MVTMVDEATHCAHYETFACGSGCIVTLGGMLSCSVVTRKRHLRAPVGAAPLNVTVPVENPTANSSVQPKQERVGEERRRHRERGILVAPLLNREMVTVSTRPPWSCSLECRVVRPAERYARRCAGCPVVAPKALLAHHLWSCSV